MLAGEAVAAAVRYGASGKALAATVKHPAQGGRAATRLLADAGDAFAAPARGGRPDRGGHHRGPAGENPPQPAATHHNPPQPTTTHQNPLKPTETHQ